MNDRIKESDWKVFKKIRPIALQRYCDKVMKNVDEIINNKQRDSHDRYLSMYEIVQDGDEKLSSMFDSFSRSKATNQLVMFYDTGIISDEELAQFSDETREYVLAIIKFWRDRN